MFAYVVSETQAQFIGNWLPLTGFLSIIHGADRLVGRTDLKAVAQPLAEARITSLGAEAESPALQTAAKCNEGVMTRILKLCPKNDQIVHVKGSLRTPVNRMLRHSVRTLLRRGERRVVLDLSAVSRIDAAGVGELVRTFNMTAAADGALRIDNVTAGVRGMLERAQLLELLTEERRFERGLA